MINLREHDRPADKDVSCRNEVCDFLCSEHFHNYVGAKRHVTCMDDDSQVVIMSKDTTYSADPIINSLVATGKPFSLATGEGDLIIPWKVVKDQAERYWDCYKAMQENPNCKEWATEPRGRYKTKRHENFEWRRLEHCGHLPFIDDADMFTEHLTQFVRDGENSSRPVQVKHVSTVRQSHASPARHTTTKVIHSTAPKVVVQSQVQRPTHSYTQGSHTLTHSQPTKTHHNVLGAGNKDVTHTSSYQPYRMSHSGAQDNKYSSMAPGHNVVRSQAYNPYTSPQGPAHDVKTQSHTSGNVMRGKQH